MKTNLEKWNYYMDSLNKKADTFMDSINISIPTLFYKVNYNGEIDECTTLDRYYSFRMYMHYDNKKPTKKDVNRIKDFFDSKIDFKSDNAYFNYSHPFGENGKHTARTAIRIKAVFEDKTFFLSKEKAEIKSKELLDKFEKDKQFDLEHKKDVSYNYTGNGYNFLGWQNGWKNVYYDEDKNLCSVSGKPRKTFGYTKEDYPEYGKCRELKHRKIEVRHNRRGSENTVSCPICKIHWKYDSSD